MTAVPSSHRGNFFAKWASSRSSKGHLIRGEYLPDKISALDKATWKKATRKKAREEAGFKATLFGGPAIGSKLDEFKKLKAKCKPLMIDCA